MSQNGDGKQADMTAGDWDAPERLSPEDDTDALILSSTASKARSTSCSCWRAARKSI